MISRTAQRSVCSLLYFGPKFAVAHAHYFLVTADIKPKSRPMARGSSSSTIRDEAANIQRPGPGGWIMDVPSCVQLKGSKKATGMLWKKGDKSVIASIVVTVSVLIGILPQKNRFDRTTTSPFLGHSNMIL
jgi:hypothetical protein